MYSWAKGIGKKGAFKIVNDMSWKSFSGIIEYFDSYDEALLSMRLVRMGPMEWKGGDFMDAGYGINRDIGTDENPLADAYEELIKYNREQKELKIVKIISKIPFEFWIGTFALVGYFVSKDDTLAILAGIYLSASRILIELRKGNTR